MKSASAVHGIAGIARDIAHCPSDLVCIDGAPDIRWEVESHVQPKAWQLVLERGSEFLEKGSDGNRASREQSISPYEVERLLGHCLEAVDALEDPLCPFGHLASRKGGVEKHLRVTANHRHGTAKIVGQHSGEGAKRRHALGGDELLLVEGVLQRQSSSHSHGPQRPCFCGT